MAGYEQTIIIGNVGRDPDQPRFLANGSSVTSFSVAVSRRWKDKQTGDQKENTNWYRVNCWGVQADLVSRLVRKGQQIMVTGTVAASAYTGQDGQMRSSLDLRCDNFQLLGGRGEGGSEGSSGSDNYGGQSDNNPSDMGDIPF